MTNDGANNITVLACLLNIPESWLMIPSIHKPVSLCLHEGFERIPGAEFLKPLLTVLEESFPSAQEANRSFRLLITKHPLVFAMCRLHDSEDGKLWCCQLLLAAKVHKESFVGRVHRDQWREARVKERDVYPAVRGVLRTHNILKAAGMNPASSPAYLHASAQSKETLVALRGLWAHHEDFCAILRLLRNQSVVIRGSHSRDAFTAREDILKLGESRETSKYCDLDGESPLLESYSFERAEIGDEHGDTEADGVVFQGWQPANPFEERADEQRARGLRTVVRLQLHTSSLPFRSENLQPYQIRAFLADVFSREQKSVEHHLESCVLAAVFEVGVTLEAAVELALSNRSESVAVMRKDGRNAWKLPNVSPPSEAHWSSARIGANLDAPNFIVAMSEECDRLWRSNSSGILLKGILKSKDLAARSKTRLSEIFPNDPLTIGKIRRAMFETIEHLPGSNRACAVLALGRLGDQRLPRLFYTSIAVDYLRQLHGAARRKLGLIESTRISFETNPTKSSRDGLLHCGYQSAPSLDAFRHALAVERDAARKAYPINRSGTISDRETWNRSVCFALHVQAFICANRETRGMFLPTAEFSADGYAIRWDKTSDDGQKVRLVWCPPAIVRELRYIEDHWLRVRQRLQRHRSRDPFFLDEDGLVCEVTSERIEQTTESYFRFRANSPRRLISTVGVEMGLNWFVSNLQMGHSRAGIEHWRPFATNSLTDQCQGLQEGIGRCLRAVGLNDASPLWGDCMVRGL